MAEEKTEDAGKVEDIAGVVRFDSGEEIFIDPEKKEGSVKLKVVSAKAPDLRLKIMGKKNFSKSMNGKVVLLKGLTFRVMDVSKKFINVTFCGDFDKLLDNKAEG